MHYWDLSQKSAFGTAIVWWPIVICIPYLGYNITKCYSLLNSRVGSPKPFYHQCNLARGIDWEQETNKECMFQLWQNWFIGMHQERSVLGCIPLLHRILFVFGRANKSQVWYTKKTVKLYKLDFFLCALMKHFQNIERNFTFTWKRTGNEERNETHEECHEVSLSQK